MLINLGMPKGYFGQLREFRKSEDINGGRGGRDLRRNLSALQTPYTNLTFCT